MKLSIFLAAGLFQNCLNAGVDYNELKPVFTTDTAESHIKMSKNCTPMETVKRWKKAAQSIKEDGTYQKIADKWISCLRVHGKFEAHFDDDAINYWKKVPARADQSNHFEKIPKDLLRGAKEKISMQQVPSKEDKQFL